MRKTLSTLLLLLVSLMTMAEEPQWQPTASWPFAYEKFQSALIYTDKQSLKAMANIHVGTSTLWYESFGKRLQAKSDVVEKVVFADSTQTTYYNVLGRMCHVLSEDVINGKVSRLYVAEVLDRPRFEESVRVNRQSDMLMTGVIAGMENIASGVADNEGMRNVDKEPLPMVNKFYMLYNDETFEVTEGNILKHLGSKEERNAYRAFTRKAEVLYGSKTSMMTVWNTFFVK